MHSYLFAFSLLAASPHEGDIIIKRHSEPQGSYEVYHDEPQASCEVNENQNPCDPPAPCNESPAEKSCEGYEEDNTCGPCNPCCTPKPKKCIECAGYTPGFCNLECAWGVFLDTEFLYFYAKETNVPFASEVLVELSGSNKELATIAYSRCVYSTETKWDPGFRLGLGLNSCCTSFDSGFYWTYFHNHSSGKQSVPEFDGISPFAITQRGLVNPHQNAATGNPFYSKMSGSWNIHFNQIDYELGRKYWLGKCFLMRPYAGLRGAWTRTHFKISGSQGPKTLNPSQIDFIQNSNNFYKTRIWGAGVLAGFQPTYYLWSQISIFADISASLLWGEYEEKKSETYFRALTTTTPPQSQVIFNDISSSLKDKFFTMSTLIALALGLRFESLWCCNRFRTALDIGWEQHIWFSHSSRYKTYTSFKSGPTFNQFKTTQSDLVYGGLVTRFRWDF